MSDPKKTFICVHCGYKMNDTERSWGKDSLCPFCHNKGLMCCNNCGKIKKADEEESCSCGGRFIKFSVFVDPLERVLAAVSDYFRKQRFSKTNHLGLGDIRLTIGQQEEILKIIAETF